MDEKLKNDVELEVRRVLSEEMQQHRDFLQTQFKNITWGVGVVFIVAVSAFFFLFGRSLEKTEEKIIREVDQKVIEYRIVEAYKKRLEAQINTFVEGEVFTQRIDSKVSKIAETQVNDNISDELNKIVTRELKILSGKDFDTILSKAIAASEKRYAKQLEQLRQSIIGLEIDLTRLDVSMRGRLSGGITESGAGGIFPRYPIESGAAVIQLRDSTFIKVQSK